MDFIQFCFVDQQTLIPKIPLKHAYTWQDYTRAKFEFMVLRGNKSTYEVAKEILPRVST